MKKINGTWLVALSGGSDSMALLKMCMEANMDVAAGHVNYHHRSEADEEERYIRSFCMEHHIPLYVKNDPFIYTGNFEACARKWRYDFFCEIVKKYHYKGVLVAHQEDDLLETYWMQKEKGIIPSCFGLKENMMYQGILVKRPLLSYTKNQLETYCKENHVKYYVDCTNNDISLTRNRIRHEVIEKMTRFEKDMILKDIQIENARMQERNCRVNTYIRQGRIDIGNYRKLDETDRYFALRQLIEGEQHVMRLKRIQQIDHIICFKNDFLIDLGDRAVVKDGGQFFAREKGKKYCDVYENLESLKHGDRKYYSIEKGKCGVFALTLKEDDFPVMIRNFEEGDTIEMRFGKKKVSRFFIDRKIPLYRRETWPVVLNRHNEVIFVSGLGCDKFHYTVNPTCNVIEYCLLKGE